MASFPHDGVMSTCKSPRLGKEEQWYHLLRAVRRDILPKYTQIYPNTPKYTQIQLQIILFLLFWDVLRIINDSLAPLSLFFHEFQQNSQAFTDLRRVAYNHEYTQISIKISSFKSLIYMNYFYIFTEILILKTILVFLRLMQLV
jgi:hypothetical protein